MAFEIFKTAERNLIREEDGKRIERAFRKKAPAVKIDGDCLTVNPNNPNFLKRYNSTKKGLKTANPLVQIAKDEIDKAEKEFEKSLDEIEDKILEDAKKYVMGIGTQIYKEILDPLDKPLFRGNLTNEEALKLFLEGIIKIRRLKTNIYINGEFTNGFTLSDLRVYKHVGDGPHSAIKINSTLIEKWKFEIGKKLNPVNTVISKMHESYVYLVSNFFKKLLNPELWFHSLKLIYYINLRIADYQRIKQILPEKIKEEIENETDYEYMILFKNNINYTPLSKQIIDAVLSKQIEKHLEQATQRITKLIEEKEEKINKRLMRLSKELIYIKKGVEEELVYFLSTCFGLNKIPNMKIVLPGDNGTEVKIIINTKTHEESTEEELTGEELTDEEELTNEEELTDKELEEINEIIDYFGVNSPKKELTFELA